MTMYNPEEKEADLEVEYSPPHFSLSCRNKIDPLRSSFRWYISTAAEHRKNLIDSGVKCKYLRYGGVDDHQTVDIFYKEGDDCKPSPLFVFIPGMDSNDYIKETAVSMVGPLVKTGYRVAVMDYSNHISTKVLERMEDLENFVTWIFQYADRSQTTDITFAGHGGGAQLLTHMLHNPGNIPDCSRSKVKSVFLLSGVYDFRELEPFLHRVINANGLREANSSDVSPMLWCWKDDSKKWGCLQIHVLTVEHISVTFQEQSRQFSQVLEAAGFNSTFKQFDGLDHFTIILDQNVERSEITNYMKTAMQKASAGSSKGSNRPCTCASKR